MKEYTTAVKRKSDEGGEAEEREGKVEFPVDGVSYTAYLPSPEQFAVVVASVGKYAGDLIMVEGIINFFFGVLDEWSRKALHERLMDPEDTFGLDNIREITMDLLEEWTGKDTGEPSASTSKRKQTGKSSTAKTPVSTS